MSAADETAYMTRSEQEAYFRSLHLPFCPYCGGVDECPPFPSQLARMTPPPIDFAACRAADLERLRREREYARRRLIGRR